MIVPLSRTIAAQSTAAACQDHTTTFRRSMAIFLAPVPSLKALPGHSADAAQQLAGSPLDTLSPPLVLDTRAAAAAAVICVLAVASDAGTVGGAVV